MNPLRRHLHLHHYWVSLLFGLLCAGHLLGSSSKIDLLRDRNAAKLKVFEAILPEKLDQSDVLRDLEMRLASDRDYKSAIQARDERLALEKDISAIESEILLLRQTPQLGQQSPIVFSPKDATLTESQLEPSSEFIHTIGAESVMTWSLPAHSTGGFEVLLTYEGPAAEIKLEEDYYYLSSTTPDTKNRAREFRLGILRLKEESSSLSMRFPSGLKGVKAKVLKLRLIPSQS